MPSKAVEVTATYEALFAYNVLEHFGTFEGKGTNTGKADTDFSKFVRLLKSGVEINKSNYVATQGSTIITLNESYMRTLANGTHTFRVEFTDGYADLILVVNVQSNQSGVTQSNGSNILNSGSPRTGDFSNMMTWWILLACSVLGLLGVFIWSKRRKSKETC